MSPINLLMTVYLDGYVNGAPYMEHLLYIGQKIEQAELLCSCIDLKVYIKEPKSFLSMP